MHPHRLHVEQVHTQIRDWDSLVPNALVQISRRLVDLVYMWYTVLGFLGARGARKLLVAP